MMRQPSLRRALRTTCTTVWNHLRRPVYFGRHVATVSEGAIVFFPLSTRILGCGIAAIVAATPKPEISLPADIDAVEEGFKAITDSGFEACRSRDTCRIDENYLNGREQLSDMLGRLWSLKQYSQGLYLLQTPDARSRLTALADRLDAFETAESRLFAAQLGRMSETETEVMSAQLEDLRDLGWCLRKEILRGLSQIEALIPTAPEDCPVGVFQIYHEINAVLNSIDCLEVRGRDSAGVSILTVMDRKTYDRFLGLQSQAETREAFQRRCSQNPLVDNGIRIHVPEDGDRPVTIAFVYKVAAEIGSLGDNIQHIRDTIRQDTILNSAASSPLLHHTILSHTRWASVGAINEANCHPVDNVENGAVPTNIPIIHVCLNGDIDNYLELRRALEDAGAAIPEDVTTDTKIIPLLIQHHLRDGVNAEEAFRRTVNEFEGSHAIAMHTDLEPGRMFVAQRGSGQTVFIGMAADHFMATSEVYGFIEATQRYIKLEGEKIVDGPNGQTQGQMFALSQDNAGSLDGMRAMYYDGSSIPLTPDLIQETSITSRDINRQDFAHYFMKEISESPISVERTLQNRWRWKNENDAVSEIVLNESTCPTHITDDLKARRIRRIYLVGQGTAGIAAKACAGILNTYFNDSTLNIRALKSSELSGFQTHADDAPDTLRDCLVIAISQSGTTTDTNRTVDMVSERGARTIAIVNRRDSDITFKVDGVMYTSSGRDIEMSVASTKAFYSQIVAGALLGLHMAAATGRRSEAFISSEIESLRRLPDIMREVLTTQEEIAASARRLAIGKDHWAAVGSGPNKAAADEIRIKLSELCYKTISSDYVEDKKHIDLSSEPLILVCAAGTRESVLGDIVKDTAIFSAHKATPVVIADAGDDRFAPHAADIFYVPRISEHLAPILNTLVGHLWGYHAALAINDGSRFFYEFQNGLQKRIDGAASAGQDVYELVLEDNFREYMLSFYKGFRKRKMTGALPAILGLNTASDLLLLLKYLTGRLPVSDFELDFGIKGTASNMLNALFQRLANAINTMARPVDAIKHQAKTVTVGTSRITDRLEGLMFDALTRYDISTSRLINKNVLVLKNVQPIVDAVQGAILYRLEGLSSLGTPVAGSTIHVVKKEGSLAALPSRVESDPRLKGTKRIIAREGNVYVGKGRKDDRNIVVIPVLSTDPDAPNIFDQMLLLHVAYRADASLPEKIKALGGKYERIKNIVQESSVPWEDSCLETVDTGDLFGISAEKISERIIAGCQPET